jgi:hypothetical protein
VTFRNDGELFARAGALSDVYSCPGMRARLSAHRSRGRYIFNFGRTGEGTGLSWSTFKCPPEPFGYNAMLNLPPIRSQNPGFQMPGLP